MFFGNTNKRKAAQHAFMRTTDTYGQPIEKDKPDVLIGRLRHMGVGLNLTRATVVILCEPIYDPAMYKQAPKRAHRLGQKEEVFAYILFSNTRIEEYVDGQRVSKSGFGVEAFKTVGAANFRGVGGVDDSAGAKTGNDALVDEDAY